MRHLNSGKQLGRNSSHRKAMYRNMVVSLLKHESITTTDIKAKELRKYVDRLITLGKRGTLAARRRARVTVNDREALQKLFSSLADRFKERPGGYTRIIKLGVREGDNAPLSQIQLIPEVAAPKEKEAVKSKAKAPKKEKAPAAAKEKATAPVEAKVEPTEEVQAEADVEKAEADIEVAADTPVEESVESAGDEEKKD